MSGQVSLPYAKPEPERLAKAGAALRRIEECIFPGETVLATLLIYALCYREFSVAEAIWVIHGHIESGRYFAERISPGTSRIWNEHHPPAGIKVASGRLHVDTYWAFLTL
jgi:hypothetical protein